jgi:tetratricopeptide (TPR) repeat protein
MKNLLLVVFCLCISAFTMPLQAQNSATIVETQSHSVFKGFFQSVWARLKSLNPRMKESANSKVIYTAGIRGAESTDTLLKPYWKGDLTQDREFQAELQKFSLAQLKMDRGELESAVESYDSFLDEYAQSDLRPNALFGKSISLAGLGDTQQSIATMQLFIDENPNHPLHDDASRVIEELN